MIRGVGATSAKRLLDAMADADDPAAALHAFEPPPGAAADWPPWTATFEALRTDSVRPAGIERAAAWYLPQMRRLHDDAVIRGGDLTQLARLAGGSASRASCASFAAELTLDPPKATSGEPGPPLRDEDYLMLSTVQPAKGQKWKAVSALNVVDDCIPSETATGIRRPKRQGAGRLLAGASAECHGRSGPACPNDVVVK